MPVDGQRHEHGVDPRVTIQLAEVLINLGIRAAVVVLQQPLGALDVFTIHITQRRDAHVVVIQKRPHVSRALSPHADDAQRDFI